MHLVITVDDAAFVSAFYSGDIENTAFHHRDHLRLAWVEIQRFGLDRATEAITQAIRHFAARHGSEARYHETMTRFWLRAINLAIRRHPDLPFEEILATEAHLLDKSLPFKHWSSELINTAEAKRSWIEPDLRAIPA